MTIPPDAGGDDDAQLIARTRAGDMTAYDELYRRHVDDATRVARIVTNNSDEAQDIVAEAFTRVLTRLREGGGPDTELTPYLRTVVRRLAIDRHRTSQRDGDVSDPSALDILPRPDDPMARATNRQLVRYAFETLPERWQQVLWHTEIEGRSPASLAPALGSSPNAVAALAYRAREGLREAYMKVNLSAEVLPGCRPYAPKIASYVRGTLSAHDTREMSAHLGQCPYCRERRDELLLLVSDMRGVLWPALLLPASAAAAAAAAGAGAGAAGGGLLAVLSPARWGKRAKQLAATGAGIAAAGVIAASAYMVASNDESTPPVAAPTASSAPAQSNEPAQPPKPKPSPRTTRPAPPAPKPSIEPVASPAPSVVEPEPSPAQPSSTPLSPVPQTSPPVQTPTTEPSPPPSATSPAPLPTSSPTPTKTPGVTPSPSPSPSPSPTQQPPAIEHNPPARPVVVAGQSLTLVAAISGNPPPKLQWQYADAPSESVHGNPSGSVQPRHPDSRSEGTDIDEADWIDIEGETSDTLVIPELTPEHDGRAYRVTATNAAGTVASEPSILTVRYAPQITIQPQDVQVDEGKTATFQATAEANPAQMSVTWQFRPPGGEWSGANVAGVKTQAVQSTLEIRDVTADLDGFEYRAVFSNELGEAVTEPATLSVRSQPRITTEPEDADVYIGDDAQFSATASANPEAEWSWQSAPGPDGPWTAITGATGGPGAKATLTIPDVTLDHNGTYYRVVFTNELGSAQSPAVSLTVRNAGRLEVDLRDETGGTITRCIQLPDGQPRAGDCSDSPARAWEVPGDGTIRWVDDGSCLTSSLPMQPTMLAPCDDSRSQQWSIDPDQSGTQEIHSGAIPGLCLDVENVAPDGRLILFPCHGGVNQQFRFVPPSVPLPPSVPAPTTNVFIRAAEYFFDSV